MIVVLTQYNNSYTFRDLLKGWGRELRPLMTLLCYCDLISKRSLPRATYLFVDIELLSPIDLARACEVAKQLRAAGMPILNDPHQTLKRYDLLKVLHEEGLNQFRAYRVDEITTGGETPRLPVFIRRADDHHGSMSEILSTEEELESTLQAILERGVEASKLIITEFCDVASSDGVFAKYSAFMIDKEFMPRSIVCNTNWITKKPDVLDDERLLLEREYVYAAPHPHEATLRRIYALAHIDFGRIDYGVKDGQIQTWEINTNPYIHPTPSKMPERLEIQRERTQKLCAAFKNLDKRSPIGPKMRLILTPRQRDRLEMKLIDRFLWPSLRMRYSLQSARRYCRRWRRPKKK